MIEALTLRRLRLRQPFVDAPGRVGIAADNRHSSNCHGWSRRARSGNRTSIVSASEIIAPDGGCWVHHSNPSKITDLSNEVPAGPNDDLDHWRHPVRLPIFNLHLDNIIRAFPRHADHASRKDRGARSWLITCRKSVYCAARNWNAFLVLGKSGGRLNNSDQRKEVCERHKSRHSGSRLVCGIVLCSERKPWRSKRAIDRSGSRAADHTCSGRLPLCSGKLTMMRTP